MLHPLCSSAVVRVQEVGALPQPFTGIHIVAESHRKAELDAPGLWFLGVFALSLPGLEEKGSLSGAKDSDFYF